MQHLLASQQAQMEHIAILTTIFLRQVICSESFPFGELLLTVLGVMVGAVDCVYIYIYIHIPNENVSEQITCRRKMAVKIVMCSICACRLASNCCVCHSRYANLTGNGLLQDVL